MAKKRLESAFIEVLDIDKEEFQQRKYFYVRHAIYVEKQIRIHRFNSVVRLIEFDHKKSILAEDILEVKAVFAGNPFGLLPEESRKYPFVKSVADNMPSLRFVEQEDLLFVAHDITTATIVVDTLETDEFGNYIVEESHIPAITSYIKFKLFEREKSVAALTGAQNFYILRSQASEEEANYHRFVLNARAQERFNEAEEVVEPNQMINENDNFNSTL